MNSDEWVTDECQQIFFFFEGVTERKQREAVDIWISGIFTNASVNNCKMILNKEFSVLIKVEDRGGRIFMREGYEKKKKKTITGKYVIKCKERKKERKK